MRRSAALVGIGEGPLVRVRRQTAKLSLKGLCEGEVARVRTFCEKKLLLAERLLEEGLHELESCDSAQVCYEGQNRHFVACVLTGV